MRGHCSLRVQEVCLSEYTGSRGSFCRVRLGTLEKFYKPTILYKELSLKSNENVMKPITYVCWICLFCPLVFSLTSQIKISAFVAFIWPDGNGRREWFQTIPSSWSREIYLNCFKSSREVLDLYERSLAVLQESTTGNETWTYWNATEAA